MKSLVNCAPSFQVNGRCPISKHVHLTIEKALNKEPDERFADASSYADALDKTRRGSSSRPALLTTSIVTLVLLILLWLFVKTQDKSVNIAIRPFANGTTRPITDWPGLEDEPSISPSGDRIAFTSDRDGNLDGILQLTRHGI